VHLDRGSAPNLGVQTLQLVSGLVVEAALGDGDHGIARSLPLTGCAVVSDGLLRKRLALDRISQAEIIGGGAALPVMLFCALAGFGIWALVIGSLVHLAARSRKQPRSPPKPIFSPAHNDLGK